MRSELIIAKEAAVEAGAIIVGKTHTHEFAYGIITPKTRNPWNYNGNKANILRIHLKNLLVSLEQMVIKKTIT